MHWLMSDGGPFICVEQKLEPAWGGINRLTIAHSDAKTDYERTWLPNEYAGVIPVSGGEAVVFTMPFDTTIRRALSGLPLIVQVEYSPPDLDDHFDEIVAKIDDAVFDRPSSTAEFSVETPALSIFDSACPGDHEPKERMTFDVEPGTYRVLSRALQPTSETSFVMHKFVSVPK